MQQIYKETYKMILSHEEIEKNITFGAFKITPKPTQESWSHGIALEGHLGDELYTITKDKDSVKVSDFLQNKREWLEKFMEKLPWHHHDGTYVLKPEQFILAYTREKFIFPSNSRIMGLVQGKSSLARIGLSIHITAPIIHPGFGENAKTDEGKPYEAREGQAVMLEIKNLGRLDITLSKGDAICQFIFEQVYGNLKSVEANGFSAVQPIPSTRRG
jgi:dCTP deaminase